MNRRLVTHPRVEAQLAEAAAWYEGERAGLGGEFLDEIDRLMLSLPANALLRRVRNARRGIRWALAGRFPRRVIYAVRGDAVFVLAVEHSKQDERGWR